MRPTTNRYKFVNDINAWRNVEAKSIHLRLKNFKNLIRKYRWNRCIFRGILRPMHSHTLYVFDFAVLLKVLVEKNIKDTISGTNSFCLRSIQYRLNTESNTNKIHMWKFKFYSVFKFNLTEYVHKTSSIITKYLCVRVIVKQKKC